MQQSLYRETVSRLAGQDIPFLLWSQNVRYPVHKKQSLNPIQTQMNRVHT
jgi:hypothetical protein